MTVRGLDEQKSPQELQWAASRFDVLAASIAHEVNQPLTGIVTNAGTCLRMLDADPPDAAGAREAARRALRDGRRAAEVIGCLRALFAEEPPAAELVDLNDAAREVVAASRGEPARSCVPVQMELEDDLPPVAGSRVQLEQVILNLLRNARDATAGVAPGSRRVVVRTACGGGDGVTLSVEDAGAGLDAEILDRLFRPWFTTKRAGMGIGLFVSRAIIENHRGSLHARQNDGPGATFSFSLPRAPRSRIQSGRHGPSAHPG